ncbi:hypothetical protein C7974DRAFT_382425 [Boeremia exigua]|uniref:uncharacterized protein n=1 Tax=Boeremia exigua TaxID=749465 RepID=UPI001E8C9E95|nr:uncharacterized protein C7974DRAFT_382425 [Boeremia exigua]KAH6643876.1 hypothetical protein C7974DRAFT_382425 [Boeremia exigua]
MLSHAPLVASVVPILVLLIICTCWKRTFGMLNALVFMCLVYRPCLRLTTGVSSHCPMRQARYVNCDYRREV